MSYKQRYFACTIIEIYGYFIKFTLISRFYMYLYVHVFICTCISTFYIFPDTVCI